jgi:hypothetical protein
MSKKTISLILFAVILGTIYVYYFTDFFLKPVIQISARPRVERSSKGNEETVSVSFSFDTKCRLTEIRVVPLADFETNSYPHAAWHLISDKSSPPIKGLIYGEPIKGMKPKVPKTKAEPLHPQVKYRLLVQAGDRQGQVDFEIPGKRLAR